MGGKYKKHDLGAHLFVKAGHFQTFQEDAGATSIKLKKEKYIYCAMCRAELEDIV